MTRAAYLIVAAAALALAVIGAFVPLLPTVPFVILAAYCLSRGSPALERRLLDHPGFGPHILAWRRRGAIGKRGKAAAGIAFGVSAAAALLLIELPLALVPLAACLVGAAWVLTRPSS